MTTARRMHPLPSRSMGQRLLIAGPCVLALGVLLALWVRMGIGAANARDLGINTWFHDRADTSGIVRSVSEVVSWIGSGQHIVPIELAFVALFVVARRWRWGAFVFVSAMGGHALSNLTKHIVLRPRPPWFILYPGQTPAQFPSFPSGHTTSGMAGLLAIAIALWFAFPRPWSTISGSVVAVIGVLQGPSRLFLAKHWLTDVIGGLLFGAGWLLCVWGAFLLWFAPRDDRVDDAIVEPLTA